MDQLPSNNETIPNIKDLTPVEMHGGVSKGSRRSGLANTVRDVGNGLFDDIVLPMAKDLIMDFFSSGLQRVIFGEDRESRSPSGGVRTHQTAYSRRYTGGTRGKSRRLKRNRRRKTNTRMVENPPEEIFEDLYWKHPDDARGVLNRLLDFVDNFGSATVGDYYAVAKVPYDVTQNYTYQQWGWDNLDGVDVYHTSDGYILNLPDIKFLN